MENLQSTNPGFYEDVRNIIIEVRNAAVMSVGYQRVLMYRHIGERMFAEEQRGQDRAKYGEQLLKNLSVKLEDEFGSGFSYRQLPMPENFTASIRL